jgi:hypothetical protein
MRLNLASVRDERHCSKLISVSLIEFSVPGTWMLCLGDVTEEIRSPQCR